MMEYFEAKIWMKSKQGENDYSMFINEQPSGGFEWTFLDFDPDSLDFSHLYVHKYSAEDLFAELNRLKKIIERQKECIEFYADTKNWHTDYHRVLTPYSPANCIALDGEEIEARDGSCKKGFGGKRARQCLKETEGV